ncbi:hypothetical protein ESA_04353 [Cronobacter sakazakii ATCC BAA-894]|uniref:Uncharacterized protein n=1 Tax=Cronobacter sakazakii (strain ATCC BAA-894) TaxID=290339 RepID=A7MKL6_CROS8|nr:hypothetical protein ESA_04353 [Cronobacter sakazakii ATCC BAA-894]
MLARNGPFRGRFFTLARTTLLDFFIIRQRFIRFVSLLRLLATRSRRTTIVRIKINVINVDLRFVIELSRFTRTTRTTIAGIGFQLVFWFEFIHLTPHSKAHCGLRHAIAR